MLSSSIYRNHSSVQRNQPCTKQQSKDVQTRTRQRKQADRAGESQHVGSLCSRNERRNRICPAYRSIQSLTPPQSSLVFSWRDARRICLFFQSQLDKAQLFPSFFNAFRIYILCGVRVVFQEHGALGICKSSVWT